MSTQPEFVEEIKKAEQRIRPYIRKTFLDKSLALSQWGGASVYCKMENSQYTGSFKVRGALNRLLALSPEEKKRGVVAASTGNHGAAVAYGCSVCSITGTIYVPHTASPAKLKTITMLGSPIEKFGNDCVEAEGEARRVAQENKQTYISPYNDLLVAAGQGTIGVELMDQLASIDVLFVSLGGGGLISGIAAYCKSINPRIQVMGCSPENSKVMIESIKAGSILDIPSLPTLSDGTAGGLEPESVTFELCQSLVDECVTVTEEEIADSLRFVMETHHCMIEGAAAVAVASYRKTHKRFRGKNVAIVLCGANIGLETLKSLLNQES